MPICPRTRHWKRVSLSPPPHVAAPPSAFGDGVMRDASMRRTIPSRSPRASATGQVALLECPQGKARSTRCEHQNLNTCTVWRRCDATLMRAAPTCRQLPRAARFPTRRAAERCPWRRFTLSLRRGTARGRRSGERCCGGAAGARALRAARRRRCARASPRRPSLRAAWRWRPAVTTGSARGSSASRVRACARARGGGRHEAHAQAPEETLSKSKRLDLISSKFRVVL